MSFKDKVGAFFGSANAVLSLLRGDPQTAMASYGIVVPGEGLLMSQLGGGCSLTITKHPEFSGIYEIRAVQGAGDWFIPYGNSAARYCDVPKGQPNGTLVITFPMNGCALEVRDIGNANRFYHDADGKNMPTEYQNQTKFRADDEIYSGAGLVGAAKTMNHMAKSTDLFNYGATYQHTIICVKKDGRWHVYNNCFFVKWKTSMSTAVRVKSSGRQLRSGIPTYLGSFSDN